MGQLNFGSQTVQVSRIRMNYLSWIVVVWAFIGLTLTDGGSDNGDEETKEEASTKSVKSAATGANTRLLSNNQAVNGAVVGFGAGVIGSLIIGKLLEEKNKCNPYRGKRDTPQTRFFGGNSNRCPPPHPYNPHNNGYHQPIKGYQQPINSYPQSGYSRPNGYNNGYNQPTNGYHQPINGYQQPINGFSPTPSGYRPPGPVYNNFNNQPGFVKQ